ncbi:MAG: hypothetical protein R3315_07545 [Woeseiaceae bacterium]|nr:hypothetical protein [Woeseiaceae bacterium]
MTDPQMLLIMTVGAFVLGWCVAKIGAYFGNRLTHARQRDPRDNRIRSLEAEVRVARSEVDKLRQNLEDKERELGDIREQLVVAETNQQQQDEVIQALKVDLRDSVRKTRELRAELSDRAEQNLRSEVKLREVETELSVAQASTDLLTTGVLDYTAAAEGEADDAEDGTPRVRQSAT